MSQNKFIGTGVAIITPFKKDKTIDYPALEKHLEYLIQNSFRNWREQYVCGY